MMRLRHADEWIGLLVVASIVAFLAIVLHAGVLRQWFQPTSSLRVLLPEAGVGGLEVGGDVEVLGIHTGTVRRIVIDPGQRMYAEADIDDQARAFIRRDSHAVIRRRFGIAGAAFIDVERGTGEALDWKFAVIEAVTERAPTEGVGALIDQVREKVFPILDDAGRTAHALAMTAERIEKGEGNVGRFLADESLIRQMEATVEEARRDLETVGRVAGELQGVAGELQSAAGDVSALTRAASAPEGGIPGLLRRTDESLASLQEGILELQRAAQQAPRIAANVQQATEHLPALLTQLQEVIRELNRAAQQAPRIAANVQQGTENLPALLTQLQQTAHELDLLAATLRSNWLLGGTPPPTTRTPLSATQIRP